MKLTFRIARRYLFAKKTTNAIHIISGISMLGITIGTAALVIVLSVFNGFEDLLTSLISNFNPDVKVTPAKGKTFEPDSATLDLLQALESVEMISLTLEEVAFFEYKKSQDFGILKGVDEHFYRVNSIDSTVQEGTYALRDGERNMAVMGSGMRNKLAVNVEDYLSSLTVYMPKQSKVGALEKPFREKYLYPAGTFVIQQDFDNQYVLTNLEFVQELLRKGNVVSAIELRLAEGEMNNRTLEEIQAIVGEEFVVRDRYQQDEAFFKLMNIEKWMSYAILSLTLLLVAFNIVGALWMIVLEKREDIAILKAMGLSDQKVRSIFLQVGLLLCGIGMVVGFVLAVSLYLIHTNLEYGLISIPQGFLVTAYPISLRGMDFVVIGLTVLLISFLASLPAANKARKVPPIILEE
jgi:lipoprotein-releasing system permease protein